MLANAIVRELELQKDYLNNEPLETIYFGGGTPSLLKINDLEKIFSSISKNFKIAQDAEITFEANPDDLSIQKLRELLDAGINRLSIGVQSFDDTVLKFINRAHDSQVAIASLENLVSTGFKNFSLDLIYAIPGLTEDLWKQTLATALSFSPTHISSYTLTIEERTVFGNWLKRGKLKAFDEESAAHQFEILIDTLAKNGYQQYEISNFCKPGFHSRHNSSYWKGTHYLGIGPSAHSYNGISRQSNVRNNSRYIRLIESGQVAFEKEVLSKENKINEYILTSLRTIWGCDLNILKSEFDDDLLARKYAYLSNLILEEHISINNDVLTLTDKGKLLADKITEDLMV